MKPRMPTPTPPSVDREKAIERLLDLLSISAPTGEEKPVADYLTEALLEAGLPRDSVQVDLAASRIPLPCQTGNLIVSLPGTAPGPRRLLVAHMDTVPLAKNAEPVVSGERIVALGQTALGGDDRTGVAVLLTAMVELRRLGLPHPPLSFLFTVREESGLRGSAAVRLEDLGFSALAFNFDGGLPNEVTTGATGSKRLDIRVRGVAAHAGVHPERGVSAVAVFAAATAALDKGGWLGLVRRPEAAGTSNIGVVEAGDATNVVTEKLIARAEARSHRPDHLERIVAEYKSAFASAADSHRNESGQPGQVDIQVEETYHAFSLKESEPVVQTAMAAVRAVGLEPRIRISNGGLDANWITRKGLPTVSFGCGQHEIHTTDEYVLIEEYLDACRLALKLATG